MPGDDDIQNLHVIIFEDAGEPDAIKQFIRKHALLASREVGKRAHYHLAIHLPEPIKRKAFIKLMKDSINKSMKGTEHFKTLDWHDYGKTTRLEQYICKGPNDPKTHQKNDFIHPPEMIHNETLIDSMTHHKNFWKEANERPNEAREKAKAKKIEGTKCIEEISLRFKGCEKTASLPIILKAVFEYYRGRLTDTNTAFPVVQAIWFKVNQQAATDSFINRMMRKFSD